MNRLRNDQNSDDEFPDLGIIVKRCNERSPLKSSTDSVPFPFDEDKENASPRKAPLLSPKKALGVLNSQGDAVQATPLRRRKLDRGQILDSSLAQRWKDIELPGDDGPDTEARKQRKSRLRLQERLTDASSDASSIFSTDSFQPRTSRGLFKSPLKTQILESQPTERSIQLRDRKSRVDRFVEVESEDEAGRQQTVETSNPSIGGLGTDIEAEESSYETAGDSDASVDELDEDLSLSPIQRYPRAGKPRPSKPATGAEPPTTEAKTNGDTDLEDAFEKLKIFGDGLEDTNKETAGSMLASTPERPCTPPPTFKRPFKAPLIPMSPFKPHENEFWDPEVTNEWNEKHSPPKRSPVKLVAKEAMGKTQLTLKYGNSPEKRKAKKAFDEIKYNLATSFLHELDERVTGGELSKLTEHTGGIGIKWSSTLQSTAGRANWKCKQVTRTTQGPDGSVASSTTDRQHHAHIELAEKVLLNEENLLNTVAHEFCHLAVFMLDGRPKHAHGPEFKAWGRKCMDVFGDSRGIVVTTRHDYEIDWKYIWRCTDCTTEVGRHSKSVDPARQRCGRCKGTLEQVKPVPRAAKAKPSAWQEFKDRELKELKLSHKGMTLPEMMKIVSSKWAVQRQATETNDEIVKEEIAVDEADNIVEVAMVEKKVDEKVEELEIVEDLALVALDDSQESSN